MARGEYGNGPDSVISVVGTDGDLEPVAYAMTAWDAMTGGTQLVDLQTIDGTAIQVVTPEANTFRCRFLGPDGHNGAIFLETSPGVRWQINPANLPARLGAAAVTEMTLAEAQDGTVTTARVISPAVLNDIVLALAVSNVHLQPTWDGTGTHPLRVAPAGVYELWRQPTAPIVDATHAADDDLWLATA